MRYLCTRCKEVWDESELEIHTWEESRGEFWGMPCTETMSEQCCPRCGYSDYLEVHYDDEEEEEL